MPRTCPGSTALRRAPSVVFGGAEMRVIEMDASPAVHHAASQQEDEDEAQEEQEEHDEDEEQEEEEVEAPKFAAARELRRSVSGAWRLQLQHAPCNPCRTA